jgi:hypothetical protein
MVYKKMGGTGLKAPFFNTCTGGGKNPHIIVRTKGGLWEGVAQGGWRVKNAPLLEVG